MSVPSKSKNAPTVGPSGLRSTSSTSSSTTMSVVGDGNGALGAVGRGQARLVEEVIGDLVDEPDAVALVVGLEHVRSQHVAAAVPGAGHPDNKQTPVPHPKPTTRAPAPGARTRGTTRRRRSSYSDRRGESSG